MSLLLRWTSPPCHRHFQYALWHCRIIDFQINARGRLLVEDRKKELVRDLYIVQSRHSTNSTNKQNKNKKQQKKQTDNKSNLKPKQSKQKPNKTNRKQQPQE